MLKKILIGIVVTIVVVVVGGFLGFKYYIGSMLDQVKLQYDKEVISELKKEVDFGPFEEGLKALTDQRVDEIEKLTIANEIEDLQKALFKGEVTSEELILFYVQRIKKYDGYYNTIIQLNPKALEQAKALDAKLARGQITGDLSGVVVLIKDNISALDMNTSTGAYALKDLTTNRDAFIVQQLKKQDAIILGKANLSEWSNYLSRPSSSGFSVLGGQTKNAYGKFDVGGSSAGSAVAEALNFATVTIGSETAGSLIYPAGQNSVVALKPSIGLLSRDLIIPISEAQDTAGVLGRSVKDVSYVFSTMLAKDANDPMSKSIDQFDQSGLAKELDKDFLKGKRLAMVKEESGRATTVKKELEALGAEVIEVVINKSQLDIDMLSVLQYGIIHDVNAYLTNPAVNSPFKSLEEIYIYNNEDGEKRIPFGAHYHEKALKEPKLSKEDYEKRVKKNRETSGALLDQVLKDNNVIGIVSFSNELSGLYAPALYPAITVPAGYNSDGEPYGVTFVASFNEDDKLLQIGYAYEQGTLHRKNPEKVMINK